VIFLLFWVGLETKISDIATVGRSAALVGVLAVIIPAGFPTPTATATSPY